MLPPASRSIPLRTVGVTRVMTDMSKFKVAEALQASRPEQGTGRRYLGRVLVDPLQGQGVVPEPRRQGLPFKRDDDGSRSTYIDLIILRDQPRAVEGLFRQAGNGTRITASGPICASLQGRRAGPRCQHPAVQTCGTLLPQPMGDQARWRPRQGVPGPQAHGGPADAGHDQEDAGPPLLEPVLPQDPARQLQEPEDVQRRAADTSGIPYAVGNDPCVVLDRTSCSR